MPNEYLTPIKLGALQLGAPDTPPVVIAEAGINHNGWRPLALEMIHAAAEAGAQVIKFQTHLADKEMLPDRTMADEGGSHVTASLFEIMSECELSLEDHQVLKAEAEKLGLVFLSTPFSVEAAQLLTEVGVPAFKIGSGEITNRPFLDAVAQVGLPMIVSTGTGNWQEVEQAVATIRAREVPLALMQCTSNYPTPYEEINLGIIAKMREAFNVPVGLSDHAIGNYACFGAVALGACVVEKHFTISRKLPGIDQPSSIEPDELADLVKGVTAVWQARGARKQVNAEAQKVRHGFSESIVTIAPLQPGDTLVPRENIWVKRPGTGIPSGELDRVSGKRATRSLPADTLLSEDDFE